MTATTPTPKRKGGRRFTDRCESCGMQVGRGKACARCPAAKPSAIMKPRIHAGMMAAAIRMLSDNPRLADRLPKAVVLAANLRLIRPTYRATVHSCKCPYSTFRGRNVGNLALCKHSLALRLAKAAAGK